MPLQQAPLDKFSAAEGERCLTDCKGSPGFPLRWLGDGVSLLLGWEFRLSTQVEKPQVTLAGGADITYCCSLGGRHWYCRWWVVVNIVLTLLGLLSHHPSQIKRGESPHYHTGQWGVRGIMYFRCLVTTWEGFPSGPLLVHMGQVHGFPVFCYSRKFVWKLSLFLDCYFPGPL